jgi:4'-phosphopantetheinyl transferase EntD
MNHSTVIEEHSSKQLLEALEFMVPADVLCETVGADTKLDTLFTIEEAAIERAVSRRRWTFTAGRHCARRALTRLGYPRQPIPVGQDGVPSWPSGVTGSISHTDRSEPIAAALIASSDRYTTLGIDVEGRGATGCLDIGRIATHSEYRCQPTGMDQVAFTDSLFTIKEASYKAFYPILGRYLDFLDVEVTLQETSFRATLLNPKSGDFLQSVCGNWTVTSELTVAAAWVPVAADSR